MCIGVFVCTRHQVHFLQTRPHHYVYLHRARARRPFHHTCQYMVTCPKCYYIFFFSKNQFHNSVRRHMHTKIIFNRSSHRTCRRRWRWRWDDKEKIDGRFILLLLVLLMRASTVAVLRVYAARNVDNTIMLMSMSKMMMMTMINRWERWHACNLDRSIDLLYTPASSLCYIFGLEIRATP